MITKSAIKTLRKEIDAALKLVGERHGVSLTAGNASFSPNAGHFKLHFIGLGECGRVIDAEERGFLDHCTAHGFEVSDLGRTFEFSGKSFTIVGLNPRARKTPVIAENGHGKRFRFAACDVRHSLTTAEGSALTANRSAVLRDK